MHIRGRWIATVGLAAFLGMCGGCSQTGDSSTGRTAEGGSGGTGVQSTPRTTEGGQSSQGSSGAAVTKVNTASGTGSKSEDRGSMGYEQATFGAGCFWGVEATFRQMPGVVDAAAGYEGGTMKNPTYQDVCTDETGHAEVVQLTFDPSKVSYETIVDTFFRMHDPTQVNRQGPDYGTQYRSVIFYHSEDQKMVAEKVKARREASGKYRKPIATSIEPAQTFYRAEEYHQQYFAKHGLENTCHLPQPD